MMKALATGIAVALALGATSATAHSPAPRDELLRCVISIWEDGSADFVRAPGKRAPIDKMGKRCEKLILAHVNSKKSWDKSYR